MIPAKKKKKKRRRKRKEKEWWLFGLKKVFLKQITDLCDCIIEQQLANQAREVKVNVWFSFWCRDRRLIKGDTLKESTCCIPNASWRSKGERKTKKYLEKDSWERAKQSRVEKPGRSQSGCTRQKIINCWPDSMKALCISRRNETWWWWKVLTLDQIDQQSNEETCENERTEQVEKQFCVGESEILVEKKNEKWGFGAGGGGRRS